MAREQGHGPAWLVVVRTNLDELPIALYSSEEAAIRRARRVTVADIDKAAEFMGVHFAGIINSAVIGFDKRGRPASLQLGKKTWAPKQSEKRA